MLKDEFEHFWDYRYRASAKKFLRHWMTAALRSRIPTLRTFVGTLRTHLVHILAFIDRPLTNAVGEGLNRIVKMVKNRASGYRHLDHFADMIYLTVGDLDIPAQIPSQFAYAVRDLETAMSQPYSRSSLVGKLGYSRIPVSRV